MWNKGRASKDTLRACNGAISQRPQIGPRRTQNVHFEAMSEFGGSQLVEQFGTKLEQVRVDLVEPLEPFHWSGMTIRAIIGPQNGPKWPFLCQKLVW